MRKTLLFLGAWASAIIFWSALSNASHSPGGKTGSPGDGADCTVCHAGNAQTAPQGWITHNIPASGYVPGKTYTITLKGTHTGVGLFGFEFTAEDYKGNKAGSWTITNSTETQLTNMNHAVTHTAQGITPSNNSKSWSFDWTAPPAGTGNIVFYGALNAADGNGKTSGDVIYRADLTIAVDASAGIAENDISKQLSIYPNPAKNQLNIDFENWKTYQIKVMDMTGKEQLNTFVENKSGIVQLDVSSLAPGAYFIQIQDGEQQITKRFIKQ